MQEKFITRLRSIKKVNYRERKLVKPELISEILECQTENILFTSSGTEACNIISHAIHTYKIENVLYLETEHSAVIDTVKSKDVNKVKCQLTPDGVINLADFENCLGRLSGKTLVCVMLVNNETGITTNRRYLKICKKYEALFFSDMIQALGKWIYSKL